MTYDNGKAEKMESKTEQNSTENRRILWKTIALCILWIVCGMGFSVNPVCLSDMTKRFEADQQQMALAMMTSSIAGAISSPLCFVIDRFYGHVDLIIGGLMLAHGILFILKPLILSLYALGINNFIDGFTFSFINTGVNSMLVSLWGSKSSSPMQALHFGFPAGALIGPFIAIPFVSDSSSNNTTDDDRYPDDSQIEYAYLIVGLCSIAVGIMFGVFQFTAMPTVGHEVTKEAKVGMTWRQVLSPATWSAGRSVFGLVILICMMLYYGLQVATMKAINVYHALYAVDANFTSEQGAAVLSASTWIPGMLSTGLGIWYAKLIPVHILLFIVVFGEGLTAILMPFLGLRNLAGYWTFCCIFSFFREPMWPVMYSWTDQYICLLAGIVGIGDIAAKLFDAFIGWLCGYVYTYVGIDSIFYVSAIFAAILCLHVVLMSVYALPHGTRFKLMQHDVVQIEAESKEDDAIETGHEGSPEEENSVGNMHNDCDRFQTKL